MNVEDYIRREIFKRADQPNSHVCCGCGGLCDSKEPCPMREWCKCRQARP